MFSKLKILHLVFEDLLKPQGGMGVAVSNIVEEQTKRGHEVCVMARRGSEEHKFIENAFGAEILFPFHQKYYANQKGYIQNWVSFQEYTELYLKVFSDRKFDVVHVHDTHLSKVAQMVRADQSIPIIQHAHLSPLVMGAYNASQLHDRFRIEEELEAYNHADEILAVSSFYKDAIQEDWIVSTNCHTVLNGCRDIPSRQGVKTKGAIGLVGRLAQNKGIQFFVEAARNLPEEKFIWWTVTNEAFEGLLEEILGERSSFPKNFEIRKDQDFDATWVQVLEECKIGVVPSTHAPFEMTALEFMKARIPLITTGIEGLSDFCNPENSVVIGRKNIAKVLTQAIADWQHEPAKIENAFSMANALTWKRAADQIEEIYRCSISNNLQAQFQETI